ncbi:SCO family protein, partial [Achromobacter spanius]
MPMLLVFLCSLAPIVAAFVVYMNPQWWPDESSNYGTLVSPQRPMPAANELKLTTLDGKPFDLQSLKGKWLLVAADGAECPESCARKLYITRNTHASQGKNVDRLARVWFITDDAPVPQKVLEAYQGTVMLRVNPDQLAHYLLARDTAAGQPGLQDPIWVIDPLGNLMMQYPAQADGVKVRKDIS